MDESKDDIGRHYHQVEGGAIMCDVCPRACVMRPGDRGFCFVRQNHEGRMALTTYGRSTGFCIDPIEKKPPGFPGAFFLELPEGFAIEARPKIT